MVKSKTRRATPTISPSRRARAIAKDRLLPPPPPSRAVARGASGDLPAADAGAVAAAAIPTPAPVLSRGSRRRAAARARTAATRAWAVDGARRAATKVAPSPTVEAKRWGLALNSLAEALPEVDLDDAAAAQTRKGKSKAHVPNLARPKARRRLTVDEGAAVRGVLEHPAFTADPLAALRLHLKNTVAQPAEVPPPPVHKSSKQQQRGVGASGRLAKANAKAKATSAEPSRSSKSSTSSKKKAAADAFKVAKRNRQAAKAADAMAAGRKRRTLGRIGEKRAKEL
ncbi:hypothetical protein MMPV_003980 [Pyropia vietnamensis]